MPDTGSITPDRIAEQFADDLPTICFAAWVGEKSDADLRRLPSRDAANIAETLAKLADRYQDLTEALAQAAARLRQAAAH
jgi:hypothetical protein